MTCNQCGANLGRNEYFVVRCSGVVEVKCVRCKGLAGIWSEVRETRAQNEATVVYRSPQGDYSFPGASGGAPPPGFEKLELRTLPEKDRFEREQNQRENQKHAEFMELRERQYSQVERQNRSDLFARMSSMSNLGRDFARMAMERNNQKARPRFDAGFHLSVNHDDARNRGESSERTGWRKRKG